MSHELRENTRFSVKEAVLVAFFPPDQREYIMLGDLTDISENGLGVCYTDTEKQSTESMQVSIFGIENVGFVSRIRCKVVYDINIPGDPLPSPCLRRCGIFFEEPPANRKDQLKQFMGSLITLSLRTME